MDMDQQELTRKEYVKILNIYLKENKIPLNILFNYYIEKGGTYTDINLFGQALGVWGAKKAFDSFMNDLNTKFSVLLVSKENKIILAT